MLLAIAVKLKELRRKTGLSQREIFKKTGQNIGRMEAAQSNITICTLERICQFYKISLEEFFDGIE
jgi:DNA-binding helix-turn-helix protein